MPEPKKPYLTKPTLRLLWSHVRRYPRYWWPLIFVLPATILLNNFARQYILAQILSRLSRHAFDAADIWGSFRTEFILYGLVSVVAGLLGWRVVMWLVWNLELAVVRDLSRRVFDHLMLMSAGFHANRFGGSLVSQANKLTGAYVRLADSTVFNLSGLVVSMVATVVILAPRAPWYVAVLVLLSAAYIVGTFFFSKDVRAANTDEAAVQSRQTGNLADSVANIYAVKTFSAARFEHDRYSRVSDEVLAAGKRSLAATIKRQNFSAALSQGMGVAAVVFAVLSVGLYKADIATVFLIVTYTTIVAENLWNFQSVLRQYNRAMGDASDMVEILQIEPEIKDPQKPEKLRAGAGAIRFDHVDFAHAESDDTLFEDFSLDIKAGEKIGLVGQSGSGKTTLTKLLLRFADIDAGAITIDGQNITAITQDDLRRVISYVPQEPLLFHRSLSENIAYGKPAATQAQIRQAARQAHADEFIAKLPDGYDTLVGERGVKLSGGQRQRVAIARAMLKSAPVLVLDEATSALDSESEKLIQAALWRLMEGRTAIVIAHRLSTIQRMDRIVVLDDGRIAEQGTHNQLLRRGGVYAKLWNHQSGGFIDED